MHFVHTADHGDPHLNSRWSHTKWEARINRSGELQRSVRIVRLLRLIFRDSFPSTDTRPPHGYTMSTLAYGLGLLGAGFAGRVAYQMMRGAKGADKFLKGGFKPKMDKAEAIQILGLR